MEFLSVPVIHCRGASVLGYDNGSLENQRLHSLVLTAFAIGMISMGITYSVFWLAEDKSPLFFSIVNGVSVFGICLFYKRYGLLQLWFDWVLVLVTPGIVVFFNYENIVIAAMRYVSCVFFFLAFFMIIRRRQLARGASYNQH